MQDKPIKIVLGDGVERELYWDLNGIKKVFAITGENPLSGEFWGEETGKTNKDGKAGWRSLMTPDKLEALVFFGLKNKEPELTIEKLGALIPLPLVLTLTKIVSDAFTPEQETTKDPTSASGPSAA